MKKVRLSSVYLREIQLNTGQLDWLPRNPRTWTQDDIDRTAASIKEDPDFLEDRPLLITPVENKPYGWIAFAGNLRHEGAIAAGLEAVPAWNPANGMQDRMENGGLSTEGREGAEGYDDFVDKFKEKLTTDDCYTPPVVYDVVRKFVDEKVAPLKDRKVIRPFFPGGNYEDLKQYPKDCVVLDNPPFSLLSKILRFYHEHDIQFFLFGPHLTLFSAHEIQELTYLPVCAPVTYENGAVVSTGFITNMTPGLKIWIPEGLRHSIREVQRNTDPIDEYLIPSCVVTSSRLGTVAGVKDCELRITTDECAYVKNLDAMEAVGKGLYGGGTS